MLSCRQPVIDGLPDGCIFHQRNSHLLTADILGDIILRGTQAAAENNQVRPVKGCPDYPAKPFGIISHRGLIKDLIAQTCTLFRKKLRVGIQNIPHQYLGTDGNQLHSHNQMSPVSRI